MYKDPRAYEICTQSIVKACEPLASRVSPTDSRADVADTSVGTLLLPYDIWTLVAHTKIYLKSPFEIYVVYSFDMFSYVSPPISTVKPPFSVS